jgi:hypothetical protein
MLVPTRSAGVPFSLFRQMTSELDRVFDDWPSLTQVRIQKVPHTWEILLGCGCAQ